MPAVFVHGVPDTARVWQAVRARLPRRDVVTLSLPGFGRPAAMKRCILALYRSAVNVGREWSGDLPGVTAPGLVLWGESDPFAASRLGARLAEGTGARFVCIPGCSHWWQLERPDTVADELTRFWTAHRP